MGLNVDFYIQTATFLSYRASVKESVGLTCTQSGGREGKKEKPIEDSEVERTAEENEQWKYKT